MGISVRLQAHITMVVFLETLFESENTLLKRNKLLQYSLVQLCLYCQMAEVIGSKKVFFPWKQDDYDGLLCGNITWEMA